MLDFEGTARVVDPAADITIRIAGSQYLDGRIERLVWVHVPDAPLTVDVLRELAAAVAETVAELDALDALDAE
ncbi:hypothetical protein [Mycobacterium helveticum]|uniref:Uncharacterized protein n=1 Tax=Mycobacterium helveticum TaxID=2592811 RepID=A0A557WW98_9MYCO|nr:hypothetical protein [Mycobacterium helveticum]TVS76952.1 hypothetical protein FPZ46_26815 [Mycobacterium helveticum]TVS77545.1 hypothetical protein FPZ47_26800 [Mycobacterium helveticum]